MIKTLIKIIIALIIAIAIIFLFSNKNKIEEEKRDTEINETFAEEKSESIKENNITGEKDVEENIINSIEDLNLKDVDGKEKDFTFKYDNNIFKAQYTRDNWKIIDSYKIKNEKDMEIICQALINIYPIHGKDGKSYRTVEDMVYEWELHNLAYEVLPENSPWKNRAKDVDFNPEDQGKGLEEMIKSKVKELKK